MPQEKSSIGVGYGDLKVKQGPIEFLQGTGVVCRRDDAFDTHFHGTMCDQDGNVFGGHLVKGENPVITVDLVLTEIDGVDFYRKYDEETNGNQFYPVEQGKSVTCVMPVSKKEGHSSSE